MNEQTARDLQDRLTLIETMIAEGRRTTRRWGWVFVLWGVAFYVAMAWGAWGHNSWAWPITMLAAVIVTALVASARVGGKAETSLGRASGAVWLALGISMFLVLLPLGVTGRLTDPNLFIAIASGLLGMANATSALILRWKVQLGCAVLWWAAAAAAAFVPARQAAAIFLVAIFFCQIAFGVYGMILERGAGSSRGAVRG